jgi:transposase
METCYPLPALKRAMKIQEVILRAVSGQIHWYQAAEIIGISGRQMRRWRARYEKYGYDGLMRQKKEKTQPEKGSF